MRSLPRDPRLEAVRERAAATQIVIDLAVSVAVDRDAGAPGSYAEAFVRLGSRGIITEALAQRLVRATGFRHVLVHA